MTSKQLIHRDRTIGKLLKHFAAKRLPLTTGNALGPLVRVFDPATDYPRYVNVLALMPDMVRCD